MGIMKRSSCGCIGIPLEGDKMLVLERCDPDYDDPDGLCFCVRYNTMYNGVVKALESISEEHEQQIIKRIEGRMAEGKALQTIKTLLRI